MDADHIMALGSGGNTQLPVDADGFVRSFTLCGSEAERTEFCDFFRRFGVAVVRDVLTSSGCEASVDELWQHAESVGGSGLSRSSPETWANERWPAMKEEGIVGKLPVFRQQALRNRENEVLQKIGKLLLEPGDPDQVIVNHDRYGFSRPTLLPKSEGCGMSDEAWSSLRASWATVANLHLDLNPWRYAEPELAPAPPWPSYKEELDFNRENALRCCARDGQLHIQGLINLIDNRVQDGGFHCVPGFHEHMVSWACSTEGKQVGASWRPEQDFVILLCGDSADPKPGSAPEIGFGCRLQRVPLRAGSVIVWDQRLPHGSRPNRSERPRAAQFFKLTLRSRFPSDVLGRRRAFLKELLSSCSFKPSPTGCCLFDMDESKLGSRHSNSLEALKWKEQGNTLFKTRSFDEAVRIYKQCLILLEASRDDCSVEARALSCSVHLNLAACYLQQGNHMEAAVESTRALDMDSDNVKGYFRRGRALRLLCRPADARDDFLRALALAPAEGAAIQAELKLCEVDTCNG